MTKFVRFCLSYDLQKWDFIAFKICLSYDLQKWDFIAFKMNISSIQKCTVDTNVVNELSCKLSYYMYGHTIFMT